MGITTCGIREIARVKGDKKEMSKSFSGLLMLHFLSTLVAIATLLICMYSIPKFFPYRDLLYIGVVKLIFQLFLVEWFYAGLEDFSYITKRTILIKILYVISVFVFVHHGKDRHGLCLQSGYGEFVSEIQRCEIVLRRLCPADHLKTAVFFQQDFR